jgi:hypothetical protein
MRYKVLPTHLNETTDINKLTFTRLLKYITDFINCLLGYICNQSIDGTFPDRLKYSKAKCILKQADNSCVMIIGQFHYMKFLTQRIPFKNNKLNLQKNYPQSLKQIHR